MLVEFCIKNYKSFKQEAAIDLSATKMTEFSNTLIINGSEKLLPISVLFGPNASGKSTVFEAYKFMTDMVGGKFLLEKGNTFTQKPFLFDSYYKERETVFEVYFMLDDDSRARVFNYGFGELAGREGRTSQEISEPSVAECKRLAALRAGLVCKLYLGLYLFHLLSGSFYLSLKVAVVIVPYYFLPGKLAFCYLIQVFFHPGGEFHIHYLREVDFHNVLCYDERSAL